MNTNTTSSKGPWLQLNERRAARAGILLLLLLLALPAVVEAQFTYTTNNGTITITGYTGQGGAVTIPDTISGLPVTSIGTNAFYACTNLNSVTIPNSVTSIRVAAFYYCISLTSVTIPNSVTSIGDEAFGYCSRLTSVTIPDSVTSIGSFVFNSCTGLTSITIPYSVTSIGDYAFWDCTSLTSITVDTLNSAYSSVDGVLFNKTQTTLVQYPAGIAATSCTIPNGVTSIGNWAFGYCSSLTDLTIPNSVTSIRAYAFEVCTSLTSVTIGSGVTSIENLAFYSCTSLTALHFRGNAPSLGGSEVFQGDNHATVYYLPGTTGWGATFGGLPTALWQPPPGAWTSSASTITPTGATLNGTVNPNGWPTAAWFQWGATTNYGNLTSVTNLGRGITALPLSVPLAGLTLNVTYHFRIAATNDNGLAYGSDQSFTTSLSPTVMTLPATDVSTNNATLNCMVNPNGWPTTAWFQWGATTNYGNLTPVTDLASGTTTLPSSAQLAGLIPSVTYHFRVAATNDYGLVYGSDQSFTTAPRPFTDANWVSLGSGMMDHVMVLAVSGTNLYAGGWFTTAGGVTVKRIAKWDGRAWSALGSGMMNRDVLAASVFALAVSGTDLYAGGQFITAGGVPANNIAKWDGSAWSPLGSGIADDYDVEALAVSGTNTYAGGFFPSAGGVPATNIAKWNGSAWSALGSGMNGAGDVWALAVSGTNLYAGGDFTTAGGVAANFIAKWDGRAWSALGSGMNNSVVALAVSGNNLYTGGKFTVAGGVPANHVAKWDGNAWSALGSGVDEYVNALAVSGTDLYAGGWFTTAGGVPANYIAKSDGRAWSALGSGLDGIVGALAADGAGHLFVAGGFTYAGTNVSPGIAEANLGSASTVLTSPPGAWTLSASTITTTSAMLNSTVNPNGYPTTAWFHWGATTNYGNLTAGTGMGSGTNALPFSAPLAGLAPGVTYHFRVVATNDYGLAYGSDQSFTTLGLPQISTLAATDVSPNSATLNGTVNPSGYPTTAWFQWGNTTSYGNLTAATALGSGTTALPLSAPLAGLTPGATYHFRIAATNDYGLAYGSDQSFTTQPQSGGADWTLNGGATMTGNTIALTVGAGDTSRSAFLNNKQDVAAFNIVFFYQDVSGAGSADGVTFCIQNDPRGATALGGGSGGSSLGYDNITPSVALAMNIFDPYTRGIAFAQNGMRVTPYQSLLPSVDIGGNTNIIQVNVDYNGTVMTMTFKDTVTGGIASTNWTVNIPSVVGGSTAYVGFTGADGGVASIQTISWGGWTPTILIPPRTQTAEAGSAVGLSVHASGVLPLSYLWYLNHTNLISCSTNCQLALTNIQFSQSGAYSLVVSNVLGAITSAPAMLNVIAAVERRPVPGVMLTGEAASLLSVDRADSLNPAPNWTTLVSISLTSTPQYWFDLTLPLSPQRFYRAWQVGTPGVRPSLELHMVPAITLTGSIGGSVRVDAINQFGPTDAWFTVDTVTLTNTSQLYFDTSAWRQPPRLYRLVQVP